MKASKMGPDFVAQLAAQWGPMGLLIGYLFWDKSQSRKERSDAEAARLLYDKEVLEYNKARLEGDKALAAGLASLTTAILKGNEK